ncbi:hypothetical protein Y032_0064g3513 [Ancylostoma ceylanicum]|uniref:Uncharacterized protein n=1 Tax=Ancylostoma ceylanicum TaxID=53326 RepID=A0A016U2B5_9BILA|nr:hypothetical protein Y032_0064g3513 [Ancylostoma ceylanicum]
MEESPGIARIHPDMKTLLQLCCRSCEFRKSACSIVLSTWSHAPGIPAKSKAILGNRRCTLDVKYGRVTMNRGMGSRN